MQTFEFIPFWLTVQELNFMFHYQHLQYNGPVIVLISPENSYPKNGIQNQDPMYSALKNTSNSALRHSK